jgi:hypothetical protein
VLALRHQLQAGTVLLIVHEIQRQADKVHRRRAYN